MCSAMCKAMLVSDDARGEQCERGERGERGGNFPAGFRAWLNMSDTRGLQQRPASVRAKRPKQKRKIKTEASAGRYSFGVSCEPCGPVALWLCGSVAPSTGMSQILRLLTARIDTSDSRRYVVRASVGSQTPPARSAR